MERLFDLFRSEIPTAQAGIIGVSSRVKQDDRDGLVGRHRLTILIMQCQHEIHTINIIIVICMMSA